MPEKYCKTAEAAELLGVTHGRIRQLVAGGRFKHVIKVNARLVLLMRAEVLGFKRKKPGKKKGGA